MQRNSLRRFTDHKEAGDPYLIDESHMASQLGTSIFRHARLKSAMGAGKRVLISAHNNRKIGAVIQLGKWSGYPVYTLTLEERATCPRTCLHWLDCYGNKMNWPTRWMADDDLIENLERSLKEIAAESQNFVVRLHVLGDFFSVEYVHQWERWIDQFPGLHVYGYTAWQEDTEIGAAVAVLAASNWDRFAVRTSNAPRVERSTKSLYDANRSGEAEGGLVCPAQTGKVECCATCGLCWQTQQRIVFLVH